VPFIVCELESRLRFVIGELNLTLSISRGFVSPFVDDDLIDDESV